MTKIIIESEEPVEIEKREKKNSNASLFLGILVGYALVRIVSQHSTEIASLKKAIKELKSKGE
jgi:hypothetical protein